MIKSYNYKLCANDIKIDYINNKLYPEWTRVATVLIKLHMNYYYKYNCICIDNKLYKTVETFLTERYKDAINRQVVGLFKSKISNFKRKYVKIVMKTNLSDELKKELCLLNKRNLFFINEDIVGKNHKVSYETIKLGRWIFKNFFGKLPSCKNINMILQDKIAVIEKPTDIKNKEIDYIIKLSAGDKNIRGNFIYLPLFKNTYADKFKGILSTSCTLTFKDKKLKHVSLTKDIEPKEDIILNETTVSFDIGLNYLFALSNGEVYGKYYCKTIKKLDKQLNDLTNSLRDKYGKNIKLKTFKNYNKLVQKTRDYSKNEINRLLNKIFKKHKPNIINIEDLDFKGSDIGATNNRLLSKFGLFNIKVKLLQFEIEYKVKVNYIDPSYTSQTCSSCCYVDNKNRKTQDKFECLSCGRKMNADVNGGKVIEYFSKRFRDLKTYDTKDRSNKRTLIVQDYMDSEVWKDNKRIIQVLLNNNYFKDYYMILREELNKMGQKS